MSKETFAGDCKLHERELFRQYKEKKEYNINSK
jgi:hypothetical protein